MRALLYRKSSNCFEIEEANRVMENQQSSAISNTKRGSAHSLVIIFIFWEPLKKNKEKTLLLFNIENDVTENRHALCTQLSITYYDFTTVNYARCASHKICGQTNGVLKGVKSDTSRRQAVWSQNNFFVLLHFFFPSLALLFGQKYVYKQQSDAWRKWNDKKLKNKEIIKMIYRSFLFTRLLYLCIAGILFRSLSIYANRMHTLEHGVHVCRYPYSRTHIRKGKKINKSKNSV